MRGERERGRKNGRERGRKRKGERKERKRRREESEQRRIGTILVELRLFKIVQFVVYVT